MEEGNAPSIALGTPQFVASGMLEDNLSIVERWWALFSLQNMKGSVAREALIKSMRDPSNLLAHEAAFALGQMQDAKAILALRNILEDVASVSSIVRHETEDNLSCCLYEVSHWKSALRDVDGVPIPTTLMILPFGGEDISRRLLWVQ